MYNSKKNVEKFLIVGLGNPGEIYNNTRHQIGAMVLDFFAQKNNLNFDENLFNGKITQFKNNNKIIFLAKPQTYMNLSGEFVKKFITFFKIPIENVLIILDDINFSTGKLRLKNKSSDGGHNGIKDIINKLNTNQIKRLKIGVLNQEIFSKMTIKEYVLSKFTSQEIKMLEEKFLIINNLIIDFVNLSFEELCLKYNNK